MSELSKLEPKVVWEIFEEITKVPRPSKKEGRIIAYLEDFAKKHGLRYRKDAIGNVVICKEATPSMKGRPAVVLQSHMDMVCEKNSDTVFDFDKDPVQAYIEDGWVKAKGTTLGADDGIGMAAQLAGLIAGDIERAAGGSIRRQGFIKLIRFLYIIEKRDEFRSLEVDIARSVYKLRNVGLE